MRQRFSVAIFYLGLRRFFADLAVAGSANFYRELADFGANFIKLETQLLK
jgi:hypothetical protein